MEVFNIYLCGGISKFEAEKFEDGNQWRVYCKKALENHECDYKVKVDNPNDYFNFIVESTYVSQKEIMEFDLNKVRNSNLIIVNFNDMYSLGSMSEIAIAYERRIPILGINLNHEKLHPWQIEMTNRIFDNIDEIIGYIKDKYLF